MLFYFFREVIVLRVSLKAARVNAKLSQREVAEKIQRTPPTIIGWEKGIRDISARDLETLCELYKCEIKDIFLPERVAKSEVRKKRS